MRRLAPNKDRVHNSLIDGGVLGKKKLDFLGK
jgi:hypothetical protein